MDMLREEPRGAAFSLNSPSQSWLGAVAVFLVVGIAYFLAARVGVVLGISQGVPIFWPAAGIAVGAFITLGPNARVPVAAAQVAATIASGILIGRSFSLTITSAFFNTGEAFLTAWLIERWFGRAFTLETVREVLGFVVASAVSEALAAGGAGIVLHLLEPTTSSAHAWRLWFASCSLGIFTVAPLVIGLGVIVRELPPRRELIEATVGLATLAAVSVFVISLPQSPWATALPVALVLPVILWIAVRCRPAFAAAAMFIVALAVIWSTTFDVGHFADASVPLSDRILAAQTLVLAAALLALVLAALFAERRRSEAALKQSERRLQLALDGAELGAFRADPITGHFECDARAALILGHNVQPTTIKESRRFVHRRDRMRIDTAVTEAHRTAGFWNAEYRVHHPAGHPYAGETRWVSAEGSVFRNSDGSAAALLGVIRDITERKRTDQALADRNLQLAMAGKSALVGTFAYDLDTEEMQISAGYAAIHGFPDGTTEISCRQWQLGVHPDDLVRWDELRDRTFGERQGEYGWEYRLLRPNGEVRWIEARVFVSYQCDGKPQRVVGVDIDITTRKRGEEQQRVLNAELDHRVKNMLATVSAIIIQTPKVDGSLADYVAGLDQRIKALARTHDLLSQGHWHGVSLEEIARRELAPYLANNTELRGPRVLLKAETAQAFAMVLHELATNAAKYGAFSHPAGRLSVQWHRQRNGSGGHLLIDWQELGGPSVREQIQPGYGTSIIRELIPFELGGKAVLNFAASGLQCRLEIPAEWLSGTDQEYTGAPKFGLAKSPKQ